MRFDELWPLALDAYSLRVTNVKDICAKLAKDGVIENTWGGRNNKNQRRHDYRVGEVILAISSRASNRQRTHPGPIRRAPRCPAR